MSRMLSPEKERRIPRAAEGLFSTRPFHEVKMDDISREAGVGKGILGTPRTQFWQRRAAPRRKQEGIVTVLMEGARADSRRKTRGAKK